ncbi:MAG: ferrous iron transporter B [Cyanobacteria bacterium P01_H01_bin.15]
MSHCHDGSGTAISISQEAKRVAVLGMPNVGKSTLFNQITGAGAFVGNWPGVTVDLLEAEVEITNQKICFVDLPGIYDLDGYSEDEVVVQDFLSRFPIDLVLVVVNAGQIDRQIRLPLQVKKLGLPAMAVLNMSDEANHFGIKINSSELESKLGMPVALVSAKYNRGIVVAKRKIAHVLEEGTIQANPDEIKELINEHRSLSGAEVEAALEGSVEMPSQLFRTLTEKIDSFLLHPMIGLPIFFFTIFLMFEFVWQVGLPSQDVVGNITDWINATILTPGTNWMPGYMQSFLIGGVWAGLATVASFVPLVVLFFFMMAIVEDSGYFSRAAYMMDTLMYRLGLDGRSFVLLIMGFGCNIPGIMGSRVMRSKALRLLNTLILPFALCSARLTVFVFLIDGLFDRKWGPIVLFSLYIMTFLVAFSTAFLAKSKFVNREPFVIELPPYRFPTPKQILLRGWGEVREFLNRATGFITIGVVAIWLLSNLPPGAGSGVDLGYLGVESNRLFVAFPLLFGMSAAHHHNSSKKGDETPWYFKQSSIIVVLILIVSLVVFLPGAPTEDYVSRIGDFFEPIFRPTGIPKELTVALIFGFIAKEIVVGSLASIYHLNSTAAVQHVIDTTVTPAQAYSFMLFCLLYTPCVATLATIQAETKSVLFTLGGLAYGIILAWIVSAVFYQGIGLFGIH